MALDRILQRFARFILALLLIDMIAGAPVASAADMPGSLTSMTALPGAPLGAAAYRIVYLSTDMAGKLVPVSGVVVVPASPAPQGGRPVVAWAHPTTGIVAGCAPSLAPAVFPSIQGLGAMLAHGYIVTATDYPGLGTPEVNPYLVGIAEGRAVLDAVRAARQIPGGDASRSFAVWGHSQGGHAALFAGLLAAQYAPELQLEGVAVAAPATDLAALVTNDLGTGGGNVFIAMTLWSWSRIYGVPLGQLLTPDAASAVDQLAGQCLGRGSDMAIRRNASEVLQTSFMTVQDFAATAPWQQLLARNSPGALPPNVPVFVAQGTGDRLVQPAVTAAYVEKLCSNGSRVQFDQLPGVGHGPAARQSAGAAVAWIVGRFSGAPAPSNCGQLTQ